MSEERTKMVVKFDELYQKTLDESKQAIREETREIEKSKLKNEFEKERISLKEKIDSYRIMVIEMDGDLQKYDLGEKINLKNKIEKTQELVKAIEAEYEEMFSEAMKK